MDLSVEAKKMVFDPIYSEEENILILAKEKLQEIKSRYISYDKVIKDSKEREEKSNVFIIFLYLTMIGAVIFLIIDIYQLSLIVDTYYKVFTFVSIIYKVMYIIFAFFVIDLCKLSVIKGNLRTAVTYDGKYKNINLVYSLLSSNGEERYKNLITDPSTQCIKDIFINSINDLIGNDRNNLKAPTVINNHHLKVAYTELQRQNFAILSDHEKVQVVLLKAFKDNI